MTAHMNARMNQRGIPKELVALTLEHGSWKGDRCFLGRTDIQRLIVEWDRQRAIAMRALDKGGLVVVEAGGVEITTYRAPKRKRAGR